MLRSRVAVLPSLARRLFFASLVLIVHVNTSLSYLDSKGSPRSMTNTKGRKKRPVNGKELSQARQTMLYLWTSLIVVLRHLKEHLCLQILRVIRINEIPDTLNARHKVFP